MVIGPLFRGVPSEVQLLERQVKEAKEAYTLIVTRRVCFWAIFAVFGALTVLGQAPKGQKPTEQQQEQEPPEEDASLKPKEYTFNPLQAEKEFRIGTYYFHKGSFKAAANRFRC